MFWYIESSNYASQPKYSVHFEKAKYLKWWNMASDYASP